MKSAVSVTWIMLASTMFIFAQSDYWKLETTTAATKFYRNTKRNIVSHEGYTLSWEKRVARTDTREGHIRRQQYVDILTRLVGKDKALNYSYVVELNEYDCKGSRVRTVRYMAYDSEDYIIRAVSTEDPEIEPSDELGEWRKADLIYGKAPCSPALRNR